MAGPPHLLVPPPVHSSLDELGFLPYCEKRLDLYRELDWFTQQQGNLEPGKDEVNHSRFADKLLADFLRQKGRVFFGPDDRDHLQSFAPVYDGKQPYSLISKSFVSLRDVISHFLEKIYASSSALRQFGGEIGTNGLSPSNEPSRQSVNMSSQSETIDNDYEDSDEDFDPSDTQVHLRNASIGLRRLPRRKASIVPRSAKKTAGVGDNAEEWESAFDDYEDYGETERQTTSGLIARLKKTNCKVSRTKSSTASHTGIIDLTMGSKVSSATATFQESEPKIAGAVPDVGSDEKLHVRKDGRYAQPDGYANSKALAAVEFDDEDQLVDFLLTLLHRNPHQELPGACKVNSANLKDSCPRKVFIGTEVSEILRFRIDQSKMGWLLRRADQSVLYVKRFPGYPGAQTKVWVGETGGFQTNFLLSNHGPTAVSIQECINQSSEEPSESSQRKRALPKEPSEWERISQSKTLPAYLSGSATNTMKKTAQNIIQKGRRASRKCDHCIREGEECWIRDGYTRCAYCTARIGRGICSAANPIKTNKSCDTKSCSQLRELGKPTQASQPSADSPEINIIHIQQPFSPRSTTTDALNTTPLEELLTSKRQKLDHVFEEIIAEYSVDNPSQVEERVNVPTEQLPAPEQPSEPQRQLASEHSSSVEQSAIPTPRSVPQMPAQLPVADSMSAPALKTKQKLWVEFQVRTSRGAWQEWGHGSISQNTVATFFEHVAEHYKKDVESFDIINCEFPYHRNAGMIWIIYKDDRNLEVLERMIEDIFKEGIYRGLFPIRLTPGKEDE